MKVSIEELIERYPKLDSEKENITQALDAMGIKCEIYRTNKEIYKIYKFIQDGKHTLDEIDDLDKYERLSEERLIGISNYIFDITPRIDQILQVLDYKIKECRKNNK